MTKQQPEAGEQSTIRSRKDHKCYGMGLGILILDDIYPGFPGDVRNASGYPFPIQYEIIEGLTIKKLLYDEEKTAHLPVIKTAARKLERMGCRAIAAECGYFSIFQRQIADSVEVPVFMSSMLQVPWAQQLIGRNKVVGILAANKSALTPPHLETVGILPGSNYVVGGAMDDMQCPEFDHIWTADHRTDPPEINFEKAKSEFISVAEAFFRETPNMGAMVLECTGFPPFASALQRKIDIPVFSWGTLLSYAFSIVVHQEYCGHV